ncbi:MAG TPA: hypothetical protein VEL07_03865 [Planctomycetota bacterium]|nr:hypothetical protein [Planctomycetota bacterium]
MPDILEGTVLDVVDGEMLELEVERVQSEDRRQYGARELVRVTEADLATRTDADDDEAAALMALTYQNRRVRCYVEERDRLGRIIGEVEVLQQAEPGDEFGFPEDVS